MATSTTPSFGLLWFFNEQQQAVCLYPGESEAVPTDWSRLDSSDAFFLSNLPLATLQEVMADSESAVNQVFHDKGLIVSVSALADELGIGEVKETLTADQAAILAAVRNAFELACGRLALDVASIGLQQREIRRHIFSRTASRAMQKTSIESSGLSLSPAPHRWVNVPLPWVEDAHFRRVTLQRHSLYSSLLRQPVPVGEWRVGSENATPEMILNTVGEHHDILLEASIDEDNLTTEKGRFVSVIATQSARELYTGQEVRRMIDEQIMFRIHRWWHGATAAAPALPETHPLSLADGIMLEMIHRSWRENPEIGFWLSIAERMTLHHLARLCHQQGIEVSGYGSGKLMVLAPNETSAFQSIDKRLLRDYHAFGVQLRLDALREHPELPKLLDYLTDQQAIALASPGLLGEIDQCINTGDQTGLEACLSQADQALQDYLTHAATALAPVSTDQET